MKCPNCERPTETEFRPFCSKRCADVDLARWVNGSYAIPSRDPDDIEAVFEAIEKENAKPH
jgi:endogenous inhibitor of DNA gyrase (YacG/DUF329 family)